MPLYTKAIQKHGSPHIKIGPSKCCNANYEHALHYFGEKLPTAMQSFWAVLSDLKSGERRFFSGDVIQREGYSDGILILQPDSDTWFLVTRLGCVAHNTYYKPVSSDIVVRDRYLTLEELGEISLAKKVKVVGNILKDFDDVLQLVCNVQED